MSTSTGSDQAEGRTGVLGDQATEGSGGQVLTEHLCERCHAEAQFGFGTTWLCESCYGIVGSCCMEFDGDDLFLEDRSWWESRMAHRP